MVSGRKERAKKIAQTKISSRRVKNKGKRKEREGRGRGLSRV